MALCAEEHQRPSCSVRVSSSSKKQLAGQRVGRFTCIEESGRTASGGAVWTWKCDCGNLVNRPYAYVKERAGCGHQCPHTNKARSNGNKNTPRQFRSAPGESGLRRLYELYKRRCLKKSIVFSLELDKFKEITSSNCFYCEEAPSIMYIHSKDDRSARASAHGLYRYNTIDRIDPNRGYEINNCRPACKACNIMKWNMSEDNFKRKIELLYKRYVIRS